MATRITKADLTRALDRVRTAYAAHGITARWNGDSELTMQTGSQLYGNAYRLYWRDPVGGGVSSATYGPDGFLGMTARDAYNTLQTIARTLDLAAEAKK